MGSRLVLSVVRGTSRGKWLVPVGRVSELEGRMARKLCSALLCSVGTAFQWLEMLNRPGSDDHQELSSQETLVQSPREREIGHGLGNMSLKTVAVVF